MQRNVKLKYRIIGLLLKTEKSVCNQRVNVVAAGGGTGLNLYIVSYSPACPTQGRAPLKGRLIKIRGHEFVNLIFIFIEINMRGTEKSPFGGAVLDI